MSTDDVPRTISLGVSSNFLNKENQAQPRRGKNGELSNRYAFGAFTTVNWTPRQIADHVLAGRAICVAACKSNWRKERNFISAQIMGIDFDHGPDVQGVAALPLAQYAFLIYATPSSTPEQPRSRALFILDQAITDPDQYRKYVKRLMLAFDLKVVDESCSDPVRIFYGSATAAHLWKEAS